MTARTKKIIQYLFFLGLGIFLVWWSIKDLTSDDKSQIKNALQKARYWLVIPVFGILLLSHYIRALRWRLLIEPLGYMPGRANTFFAVMVGYLANQAVPRLGEVLKCTILARYEKIPADKLIGTIILERIIDALTLLLVFGITLAIQPGLYNQIIDTFFASKAEPGEKNNAGQVLLIVLAGLILIAIAAWMIIRKKNFRDLFSALRSVAFRIWMGIAAIQHLRKRGQFIALTITLWTLYLSGGFLGFFALQETSHYGIKEAFTILSAGSIGMIATPGGIGAYAYLIEQTMILYGLGKGIALAFGWLLWLAQTAVIVLGGFVSFVLLPWHNKRKSIEAT